MDCYERTLLGSVEVDWSTLVTGQPLISGWFALKVPEVTLASARNIVLNRAAESADQSAAKMLAFNNLTPML